MPWAEAELPVQVFTRVAPAITAPGLDGFDRVVGSARLSAARRESSQTASTRAARAALSAQPGDLSYRLRMLRRVG